MKKAIIISTSLFLALFAVLVVHIILVLPSDETVDNANIQVSAINFDYSLSETAVAEIQSNLKNNSGIISSKFLNENKALMFYFDNQKTTSDEVLNLINNPNDVFASKYSVPAEMEGRKVCPAILDNSLSKKIVTVIKSIIS